jgi:hypothetical protein
MKVPAIAFLTLLSASFSSGKCSVVEVLSVEPSSQKVRIVVLHGGTPLSDVRVEAFSKDEQPHKSVSTNKRGVAQLSLSPPGRYHIAANAAGGLGADLILDVSKGKGKNVSSFTLNLTLRPPPPPSFEDRIVTAENAAAVTLRQFAGSVTDPAGAVIAQTEIEVFEKGSRGTVRALQTESDAAGQFSAQLPEGSYTAVFRVPGFSVYILVFEISEADEPANAKSLRIPLQIAPCS